MSRRATRHRTVVLCPDSFKGSLSAAEVAEALAEGWRSVRPGDELVLLPQADGGEGTAAAVEAVIAGSRWRSAGAVRGPGGVPTEGRWLALPGGTAVIELAQMSGLPLLRELDPLRATTHGLGEVIAAAVAEGARELLIGLGGSASTDGGAGMLRALGARLRDAGGSEIPDGGGALDSLAAIDLTALLAPPPGGVRVLVDTRATLFGPGGAAELFGAQKGADGAQRARLDTGLRHWADLLARQRPVDPGAAGAGAAGGCGFGLAAWGGRMSAGAAAIADLTGLPAAIDRADVVVTGEGRFDATSTSGKLVGSVLEASAGTDTEVVVVAGSFGEPSGALDIALTGLAGGPAAALAEPHRWCVQAGARAAAATGAHVRS